MSDDLLLRPASELARLVADRLVSARELLAATRDRVDLVDPVVNAVVTVDWDRAEHEALAADELTASGRVVGRLHGLPMTVKDSIETQGLRTTCGVPELVGHVPPYDAPAVARLRSAGAVVYGKTNVPRWAGDCQASNPVFGTTNNPWDLGRTPGGSSGGAAVAVATGMAALELGSDLGGSIRLPAHFTGTYTLKPSYGVVPSVGHLPPRPGSLLPMDVGAMGPLARSADDLDLVLQVLAGPHGPAATAWRLSLPPPRAERLQGYRIGVWTDDPACPVDTATRTALEELADALRRERVTVVDVSSTAPGLGVGQALARRLVQPLAGGILDPADFDAMAALADPGEWERNVTCRARDLLAAQEERAVVAARWAQLFLDVDVVLTPVTPAPAFPHDHTPDHGARTIEVDGRTTAYGEQFAWLQAVSALHLPAVVAPLTRSGGLPIGVQVVGPHLEDRTAVDVARRLARVTGGFVPPPLLQELPARAGALAVSGLAAAADGDWPRARRTPRTGL